MKKRDKAGESLFLAGRQYGGGGLALGQVRILVADQDAEEAQLILNTPPPPDWDSEETLPHPDPE